MLKLTLAIIILQLNCTAFAAQYILEIYNQTQQPLHDIYVSGSKDQTWENDLLDENEFLEKDGQISLTLTDYDSPYFDIRAIDEQGNFYYRYRVNAEQIRINFTPEDRVPNSSPKQTVQNLK